MLLIVVQPGTQVNFPVYFDETEMKRDEICNRVMLTHAAH